MLSKLIREFIETNCVEHPAIVHCRFHGAYWRGRARGWHPSRAEIVSELERHPIALKPLTSWVGFPEWLHDQTGASSGARA
jgi:hypothetical protein